MEQQILFVQILQSPLLTNRVGKGLCYRMSVIYSMAGTSIWEP